jgi:hypothetical protein
MTSLSIIAPDKSVKAAQAKIMLLGLGGSKVTRSQRSNGRGNRISVSIWRKLGRRIMSGRDNV